MKSKAMALLILMSIVCFSGMHEDIDGQSQAAKRAISEMDLFDFVWIGDPQISPDGSQVVFYRVALTSNARITTVRFGWCRRAATRHRLS